MLGTSGFFKFIFTNTVDDRIARRYAFAYKPPGPFSHGALQELILQICKGPLVPDAVVLLGLAEDATSKLLETLKSDALQATRERISGRIPLVHCSISLNSGKAVATVIDHSYENPRRTALELELQDSSSRWLKAGMQHAFPLEAVVLCAPPGYAYQKPSGARYHLFLKPDLGLTSSAAASFVAMAIILKFYAGRVQQFTRIQTVFVDTMAISNVAYGLRELLQICKVSAVFVTESFHSYGGFESIGRPLQGTSLCLISASSSMSLHQQWISEKQVSPEDVITLLTFESPAGETHAGALLAVPRPSGTASEGPPQLLVRIKGETFLPNQEPDKKFLLREKIHSSPADAQRFSDFAKTDVLDIYRRQPTANSKVRALFVDGIALINTPAFTEWLNAQLQMRVKAAANLIVHQPDRASALLAARVKDYCVKFLGFDEIKVLSSDGLSNDAVNSERDGVMICAAVVGKGSQLLEISRTLRDMQSGPRLYIIGFQVAETHGELATLKSNLVHSKHVSHDMACFGAAAIGTQLQASFAAEMRCIYPPGFDQASVPPEMALRATLLGGTKPIRSLSLVPHGADVASHMRLRSGWAFWPTGYDSSEVHPAVIATVAVLLQKAREDSTLPENNRLASATFQHVILDPENFTRFNDGILQAALLRCAYPSELDYRANYASSDFMKAVIVRALRRATEEAGEAVLEFLVALATNRLQLAPAHRDEILTELRLNEIYPPILLMAINHIFPALYGAAHRQTSAI